MPRWSLLALAYASVAALALSLAEFVFERSAFTYATPWLKLPGVMTHVYSLALGVALGALVVFATRKLVDRAAWARELARALRPFARGLSGTGILLLALFSSLGEELLFRGLLQPSLGLWFQALLFGVLHQVSGPSRWAWVTWAGLVGLLFGMIFAATGSLLGPIAAHALINGLNLNFLQNHDPELSRRGLGGLLGQRSRA
ncbi:MAG TPA: type II CAAX endopeptidase family protein [Polyangiaceae bacterium]|nr:type II CAAX endopeptidase family protein [Polyangiaceae bacterium]